MLTRWRNVGWNNDTVRQIQNWLDLKLVEQLTNRPLLVQKKPLAMCPGAPSPDIDKVWKGSHSSRSRRGYDHSGWPHRHKKIFQQTAKTHQISINWFLKVTDTIFGTLFSFVQVLRLVKKILEFCWPKGLWINTVQCDCQPQSHLCPQGPPAPPPHLDFSDTGG